MRVTASVPYPCASDASLPALLLKKNKMTTVFYYTSEGVFQRIVDDYDRPQDCKFCRKWDREIGVQDVEGMGPSVYCLYHSAWRPIHFICSDHLPLAA